MSTFYVDIFYNDDYHIDKQKRSGSIHKCKYCGYNSTRKGDVTKHERIHTGSKPFLCEKCGKKFTQSSHLCVHKKTHSV